MQKYKLLQPLPGIPAGTIFIHDEENNRWYPDIHTDINMQYNGSWILQNNPDWFAPFDGYIHGITEHTWTLVDDANIDEDLEAYECSTQGCDGTLTQPKKPVAETPAGTLESPSATPNETPVE